MKAEHSRAGSARTGRRVAGRQTSRTGWVGALDQERSTERGWLLGAHARVGAV